jgi:hypothetical protein
VRRFDYVRAEHKLNRRTGQLTSETMPVTTRLLHRLQETLGVEATDDLLSWWDEATRVNRSEVREVAELYFQRFNAELQRGLAEVRGETQKSITELGARLDTSIAELRTEMASQRADLIKWMFLFWAGTVLPLAGLAVALVKL